MKKPSQDPKRLGNHQASKGLILEPWGWKQVSRLWGALWHLWPPVLPKASQRGAGCSCKGAGVCFYGLWPRLPWTNLACSTASSQLSCTPTDLSLICWYIMIYHYHLVYIPVSPFFHLNFSLSHLHMICKISKLIITSSIHKINVTWKKQLETNMYSLSDKKSILTQGLI